MLTYLLVWVVGLGSLGMYLAAFFFPELHRKNDLIWSGVGLFYALVIWVYSDRIRGGFLLGQTAGVALLVWLGWQTFQLRRELTPAEQKTPMPDTTALKDKFSALVTPLKARLGVTHPLAKPSPPISSSPVEEKQPVMSPPPVVSVPEPSIELEDEWETPALSGPPEPTTVPANEPLNVPKQSPVASVDVSKLKGQAQELINQVDVTKLKDQAQGLFQKGKEQLQRWGVLSKPATPSATPPAAPEQPQVISPPADVAEVTIITEVIETFGNGATVEIIEERISVEPQTELPVQPEVESAPVSEISEPETTGDVSNTIPTAAVEFEEVNAPADVSEAVDTPAFESEPSGESSLPLEPMAVSESEADVAENAEDEWRAVAQELTLPSAEAEITPEDETPSPEELMAIAQELMLSSDEAVTPPEAETQTEENAEPGEDNWPPRPLD